MKFSDIPGHTKTKETLVELADTDRIPHALMLCGPSGIGKMMTARAFAQYVHCRHRSGGEPCGKCPDCMQHQSFNHPDMHFIYPIVKSEKLKRYVSADEIDSWKRMLSEYPEMPSEKWLEITQVGNSQPAILTADADQLVHNEAYASFSAKYKFFIIWLPEKMRPEAANKLLKVIEEPTEGTIFILVSNDEKSVLPTISSRTRRLNMAPISQQEMTAYFMSRFGLPDYQAMEMARISEGRISKAVELGEHSGESSEFDALFRDIMRAAYAKKIAKLKQISEAIADFGREKIRRFLSYMARMTRENFIYNLKMPSLSTLSREEEEFSRRFSPFIHHSNVEEIAAEIAKADKDISRNGNAKIVIFDFFLILIALLLRKPAP